MPARKRQLEVQEVDRLGHQLSRPELQELGRRARTDEPHSADRLVANTGPIGHLHIAHSDAAGHPVPDLPHPGGRMRDRGHLRVRGHADHLESGFQAG